MTSYTDFTIKAWRSGLESDHSQDVHADWMGCE